MAFTQPVVLSPRGRSGFTLVEVAISIAVISVAFVSLLALLPAGNTQFRRAMDLSIAAQIAQRVISDCEQTEYDVLLDSANASNAEPDGFTFRAPYRSVERAALRYFDDQGREIKTSGGKLEAEDRLRMIYQVNVRVMPHSLVPGDRAPGKPAGSDLPLAPRNPMALVTVQVAHNPGNLTLPFSAADASEVKDASRNLWKITNKQAGVEIYTYSALIGRH